MRRTATVGGILKCFKWRNREFYEESFSPEKREGIEDRFIREGGREEGIERRNQRKNFAKDIFDDFESAILVVTIAGDGPGCTERGGRTGGRTDAGLVSRPFWRLRRKGNGQARR